MLLNRFRDQKGNYIPLSSLMCVVWSFVYTTLRITTGFRPAAPTISQKAAKTIRGILTRDARIAEFGSGLSTIWFARQFSEVVSVEHDANWAKLVESKLCKDNLDNVTYLVRTPKDYESSLDRFPNGYFDLILVDGLKRDLCLRSAFPKLRQGGYIYLDNTDTDLEHTDGEMRRAEKILIEAVTQSTGDIVYFTDFSPINFFAEQGALAKIFSRGK